MSKKCTNSRIGNKLSLDVVFNGSLGQGLFLPQEYIDHLCECGSCRDSLPLLFCKADAAQQDRIGFDIFNRAQSGDERIFKRNSKSGTILFELESKDSSRGLLVIVTPQGGIFYEARER